MCCVAAVIPPYPKGLLLLSFLQHRGVTCLAASIEENSIQSQRGKGDLFKNSEKTPQLLVIVPHYLASPVICFPHAGVQSITAPTAVSPMWKHTLCEGNKSGPRAAMLVLSLI